MKCVEFYEGSSRRRIYTWYIKYMQYVDFVNLAFNVCSNMIGCFKVIPLSFDPAVI